MVRLRLQNLQSVKARFQTFQAHHTNVALKVDELQSTVQRINQQIRSTPPGDFAKIRVLEGQRTALQSQLSGLKAQLQVLEQALL